LDIEGIFNFWSDDDWIRFRFIFCKS